MMHESPEGCAERSWPPVWATTWAAAALQSPATRATDVCESGDGAETATKADSAATLKGDAMCYAFTTIILAGIFTQSRLNGK